MMEWFYIDFALVSWLKVTCTGEQLLDSADEMGPGSSTVRVVGRDG